MELDKDLYDTLNMMPGIAGNLDLLIKDFTPILENKNINPEMRNFCFRLFVLGALNVMNPDSYFNKEYKRVE